MSVLHTKALPFFPSSITRDYPPPLLQLQGITLIPLLILLGATNAATQRARPGGGRAVGDRRGQRGGALGRGAAAVAVGEVARAQARGLALAVGPRMLNTRGGGLVF